MLKIIDEYDLKGLEKFGFRKENSWYDFVNCKEYSDFYIDIKTRKICYELDFGSIDYVEETLEVLFDLIQAGIVEKVEE